MILFRFIFATLLTATVYSVSGQISSDSLRRMVSEMEEGPEQLKLIIDLADVLNWEDIHEGKKVAKKAVDLAKKLDDKKQLGDAYIEYAESIVASYPDSFWIYYGMVKEVWTEIDYKKGLALILVEEGLSSENGGLLENSMRSLIEALAIFEELGDDEEFHNTEVSIAALLTSMGRGQDALDYLERARNYIFNSPVLDAHAYYYLVMGEVLIDLERKEEAIATYKELQKLAIREKYYNDVVSSSTKLASLYLEEYEYEVAKMNLDTALKYAELFDDGFFLVRAHKGLGEYYLALGEYENAVKEFEYVDKARKDPYLRLTLNDGYLLSSEAHKGLGDYKGAYENLLKYSINQDSIFNTKSVQIAQETEAKYETDKKQALLEKQKRERNVLLLILSLVFASALGLVIAYRKIKTTNGLLKQTNIEKEYLIKEIHHRVKNNLQVLSSLLNLQSDYIDDPSALNAVSEGKNRVQSMALLHQRLYSGDNLAAVDMKEYIADFTDYLMDAFDATDRVQVEAAISVPKLDIDTAVPLGLIINELITNSLKYGFAEDGRGVINVELKLDSDSELCLRVADNGLGSEAKKSSNSTSFGTDLIKILCKKLKGVIAINAEDGYETLIRFKKYKLV